MSKQLKIVWPNKKPQAEKFYVEDINEFKVRQYKKDIIVTG